MPTALIADDEPALARALAKHLARLWPELTVLPLARNGLEAAEAIARDAPDVAFLDIQMPGLTGLEVAQGVEGRTALVFVTAYDQYAVQAFEQAALDYVLKPVRPERLQTTLDRLRPGWRPRGPVAALAPPGPLGPRARPTHRPSTATATATTTMRTPGCWLRCSACCRGPPNPTDHPSGCAGCVPASGDLTHQVDVQEVLFFQADDKYTCVRTTAGAEHLIRTPIQELAQQLDAQQFQQVHRSTLVNLKHLAGTRRDEASRLWLRLHGWPHELPVSRAYVHLFKPM